MGWTVEAVGPWALEEKCGWGGQVIAKVAEAAFLTQVARPQLQSPPETTPLEALPLPTGDDTD